MAPRKKAVKKAVPKRRKMVQSSVMGSKSDQITRLAKEATEAYRRLQNLGKYTFENWQDWLKKLPAKAVSSFAAFKKDQICADVERLSNEIIKKIQTSEVFLNRDKLIREVRQKLDEVLKSIQKSEIVSRLSNAAAETKKELLSFLNAPFQAELKRLQDKVQQLEKKVDTISRKRP